MNILLTSVGRRSYLVEYFKQALNGEGMVVCTNMYANTAGMFSADIAITTPASYDSSYIPQIIDICRKYEIGLICSFHDLDVYILSQHLNELRSTGAIPILPSAEWGRISLDKYECTCHLRDNGINVPWTSINLNETEKAVADGQIHFPLIIKARMGFGSQGLSVCNNMDELKWAFERTAILTEDFFSNRFISCPMDQRVLIQQLILGKEYCIDVVNDLTGQYSCSFVVEVHAMRAGESDIATTIDPLMAGDLPLRLSKLTKHLGIWGVDCLEDQGVLKIIDINPRFTGDYPFHQISGADIPAALIYWARNNNPDPSWLKAKSGILGYKDLVPSRHY